MGKRCISTNVIDRQRSLVNPLSMINLDSDERPVNPTLNDIISVSAVILEEVHQKTFSQKYSESEILRNARILANSI